VREVRLFNFSITLSASMSSISESLIIKINIYLNNNKKI
jgi:hypothetical protein